MPILDLAEFAASLPARKALIGLDPGSTTIGVAASDFTRLIASPAGGVKRSKWPVDAAAIFKVFDDREACGLVVGHPINMDGRPGPSAQAARAFARNLLAIRDVPLLMWDERLSTAAVQRQMIAADMSRAKRAAVVDSAAAAYMLQGLLDRLQSELGTY
ncbi:putative pre-16S rRNA nuclease [Candidatus Phycosocius bacilliformis]|uniref:Putative pre-16S rRNA nuclease n=1 Tax=Candidatus Phycosocius bacilliformis TaxID=1445552 RepID=A0A2P2EE72_9PROT|nr:Holliday junction resolvase RuvX [Candidatus Phycosocius bacilliformis]GBF59370.1 putative pre-16S rRNA nuclease [Candidatus Phycosocius bacilliformis]